MPAEYDTTVRQCKRPGSFQIVPLKGAVTGKSSCYRFGSSQVPSSHQLLFGPLLWLGAMALMPGMDRALPPILPLSFCQRQRWGNPEQQLQQCHLQQQHHLVGMGLWDAALSFLVIVVLPYVVVRAWEVAALRPKYEADLEAAAAAAAALQRQQQRQPPLLQAAQGRPWQSTDAHGGGMRARW